MVMPAIAQQIEDRETALVHDNGLAVYDAGIDGQACDGIHDQAVAISEVIAVPGYEFDLNAVLPR